MKRSHEKKKVTKRLTLNNNSEFEMITFDDMRPPSTGCTASSHVRPLTPSMHMHVPLMTAPRPVPQAESPPRPVPQAESTEGSIVPLILEEGDFRNTLSLLEDMEEQERQVAQE